MGSNWASDRASDDKYDQDHQEGPNMIRIAKWSVRGLDPEALNRLWEVKEVTGASMGALVSEAVTAWYDDLPEAEDDHSGAEIHP